jgi:hypothetical protein
LCFPCPEEDLGISVQAAATPAVSEKEDNILAINGFDILDHNGISATFHSYGDSKKIRPVSKGQNIHLRNNAVKKLLWSDYVR